MKKMINYHDKMPCMTCIVDYTITNYLVVSHKGLIMANKSYIASSYIQSLESKTKIYTVGDWGSLTKPIL